MLEPDLRKTSLERMGVAPAIIAAQPFLKWAGGKGQLLTQLDGLLPKQLDIYFEPFTGGGAVFFHLKHRFPRMRAFLRDSNADLINAYQVVRDFPDDLMARLDEHLAHYRVERERYFYHIRSQHEVPFEAVVERAARMIFLNKTCFNGLWRVNARGQFNVPIGSHKNPALYDRGNILAASLALQGAHLAVQDFRNTMEEAGAGDFIYIDPPYAPVSPTASFTSYTREEFGLEAQRELAGLFAGGARRGVRLMLSNSDTPFIRELYGDFVIHTVRARRAINSNGLKRGEINEVVITC
ncbi:MAG TPA: DNA adenine methylase [Verrucomicrobiae bacterium]|nr:DNA adenine methylase [Verrucomicrobiae bacterium]